MEFKAFPKTHGLVWFGLIEMSAFKIVFTSLLDNLEKRETYLQLQEIMNIRKRTEIPSILILFWVKSPFLGQISILFLRYKIYIIL